MTNRKIKLSTVDALKELRRRCVDAEERFAKNHPDDPLASDFLLCGDSEGWEIEYLVLDPSRNMTYRAPTLDEAVLYVLEHDNKILEARSKT